MRFLALLALLFAACAPPAFAESNALPGDPNVVFARFPFTGVSTVTADVVEIGGAQIGADAATFRQSIDATPSDVFWLDISTLAGYPAVCGAAQSFVVRFQPSGADCATSPSSCVDVFTKVGGEACPAAAGGGGGGNGFVQLQTDPTFATGAVSAQGISRRVIDQYARHGQLPIRWRRFDYSALETYGSADRTKWEVYFYAVVAGLPQVSCIVETETDPATVLPASTCASQ